MKIFTRFLSRSHSGKRIILCCIVILTSLISHSISAQVTDKTESEIFTPGVSGPDLDRQTSEIAEKEFQYSPELKRIMPGFDQRIGKCLGLKKEYDAFCLLPNASLPEQPLSSAWQPVGSTISGLVSGRVKGIALDEQNHRRAYIAAS